MPGEARKSLLLRIDPRLWKEIEAWAREDLRSVNGQIEFLLRQAVLRRRGGGSPGSPIGGGSPSREDPAQTAEATD
jgi:hypothetical protein